MPEEAVAAIALMSSVSITLILAIALTRRYALRARHAERMAMIEQGMHPDEQVINGDSPIRVPTWMKIGSTAMGIGAGFVLGTIVEEAASLYNEEVLTLGSVLLMGGLGLSLPYFVSAYFQTHADKRGG